MATRTVNWNAYGVVKQIQVRSFLDLIRIKADPELERHVKGFLWELRQTCVEVRVRTDIDHGSGSCVQFVAKDDPSWRKIHLAYPKLSNSTAYMEAMHEIGHAFTHNPAIDVLQSSVECEYVAWQWVLDNMIIEPSRDDYEHMVRWFGSYLANFPKQTEERHLEMLRGFCKKAGLLRISDAFYVRDNR